MKSRWGNTRHTCGQQLWGIYPCYLQVSLQKLGPGSLIGPGLMVAGAGRRDELLAWRDLLVNHSLSRLIKVANEGSLFVATQMIKAISALYLALRISISRNPICLNRFVARTQNVFKSRYRPTSLTSTLWTLGDVETRPLWRRVIPKQLVPRLIYVTIS